LSTSRDAPASETSPIGMFVPVETHAVDEVA